MTSVLKAAGPVRCRLFGAFSIEGPGGSLHVRGRRARALIAYLAFAGPAGATRERLSGLLWSDRGEDQARASLRQCLLELRRELAEAEIDALDVGRQHVTLRSDAVSTDVGDLEDAVLRQDSAAIAASLRAIAANTLLEDTSVGGLYDDWLSRTRAQLDNTIEREVRRIIEAAEGRGDWAEVRNVAEAFLLRSPADETVAAAAIRADMAMGVTSAAHRRFRALESTLANEYGLRPGASVSQALSTAAEAQSPPRAPPTPPPTRALAPPPPPPRGAPVEQPRPIIVVSAFEGAEISETTRALAETVRDEVVSGLSRFRDLSVVTDPQPASSLDHEAFADPQLVFAIGARMRAAGRPGMTVQLLRLNTRNVLWSDGFDVPDAGILTATDSIVDRVVGAVLPSIDQDLARPHREADGGSSYLTYLHAARQAQNAATYDEACEAADALKALIASHPNFVLPYLPLAYLYNTDFNYTLAGSSDPARRDEALGLAKTAMALDRGHLHGYVVAAWSYLRQRRWEPALRLFEQALSLNPFNPSRLKEIGFGLLFLDQRDRARELLNRCLLVNPTPEDNYFIDLGLLELICGNHERAATYFDLVASPTIWSTIYQAVNSELSGQGPAGASQLARQRIASIWPREREMTPDAAILWMLAHNPFLSRDMEDRFVAGARMMLDPVSSLPTPA